jgi:FK506-binding protein 4/5
MSEMATSKNVAPIDADDENRATEIETAALTNIAMCYLKLKEPKKAIEFCQKALKTNPAAWKAALRKSEAQSMMGNFELARSTITDALSMAPDAPSKSAILKEREKQTVLERESNIASSAKQKKAFSKMFEKDSPSSDDA